MTSGYIKITKAEMQSEFFRILVKRNFSKPKAEICATIFTENSLDGVYTHGVNRFPKLIQYVDEGHVKPEAEPVLIHQAGCIAQWHGKSAVGPLNALLCTDKAMELASKNGMGCVAIANTNHWMRGGTYGWKAAKAGFIFIGWTNTMANMPAWGAIDNKLGNNPLVIAVPYGDEAIVLDMAMSQYSYGALELHELKNEQPPVPGGFDVAGKLTQDPAAIRESRRVLPIGYWKGAGLSLLLDILASILSGGLSTSEVSKEKAESNLSQVFIAIDITKLNNYQTIGALIQQIIDDYHQSTAEKDQKKVLYPGERVLTTRKENLRNGIPVVDKVWKQIQRL
jgi:3-dehydro-L-gulonate 2-dehydrogenase